MSCGAAFVGTASSDGDKQQPFDVSELYDCTRRAGPTWLRLC